MMRHLPIHQAGAALVFALWAAACSLGGGGDDDDDAVANDDDTVPTTITNDDDDSTPTDDDDTTVVPDDDDDTTGTADDDDDSTEPGPDCGDALTEAPEACDGDERDCTVGGYEGQQECKGDCTGWADCLPDGRCGDGAINGLEQCDDGPGQGEGRCLDDCTSRQLCNDGAVNGSELCETGGPQANPCCLLCEAWLDDGEACDTNPDDCLEGLCAAHECVLTECPGPAGACGNRTCAGDACAYSGDEGAYPCPDSDPCRDVICADSQDNPGSTDCLLSGLHPDGTPCEDSEPGTPESYCQAGACIAPECGNGLLQPGEACDGGLPESCTTLLGYPGLRECKTDCSGFTVCESVSYCGDGAVGGPEYCDSPLPSGCEVSGLPGEQICKPDCKSFGPCIWTGDCGDGIVQPWEQCETFQKQSCATADGYPGFRPCMSCTGYGACGTNFFCGEGLANGPEECDEGGVPSESCTVDCKSLKVGCGNRRLEPELGEICDDGLDNGKGPHYCRKDCLSVQPLVPNPMGHDYSLPNFVSGDLAAPTNAQALANFLLNDAVIPATIFSFPGKTCLSGGPYPGYNCTWDTAWCYPDETCQDTPAYDRVTRTLDGFMCFGIKFDGVVVQQDDTEGCILFQDAQYSSPPNFRIQFPGPKTFSFNFFDMDIIDFDLRGRFNAAADTMIIDRFSGRLDTEDIRQQTHFDICLYIICNPDRTLYVEVNNMQAMQAEFPVRYLAP